MDNRDHVNYDICQKQDDIQTTEGKVFIQFLDGLWIYLPS